MGMVASVTIWVGVNTDSDTENSIDLTSLLNENQCDELDNSGGIEIEGLTFKIFYRFDEEVGFGVELFSRSYFHGVTELNLQDLLSKSQELLRKVRNVFQSWASEIEPKVFIDMDHS